MKRVLCIAAALLQACGGTDAGLTAPFGTFTLSTAPSLSLLRGGRGEARIIIDRTGGYGGVVTINAATTSGAVTAIPLASTTGTEAFIELTAGADAPGTATLTVTATGLGTTTRTATINVSLLANTGGAGNVAVDLSRCNVDGKSVAWFAYQDGSGPWRQILGTSDLYQFRIDSAKGGYAYVRTGGPQALATVTLRTKAELTSAVNQVCPPSSPKTVAGSVIGLAKIDFANVGLGTIYDEYYGITSALTSFTLRGVPAGPADLVAYRYAPSAPNFRDRAIIRRDVDVANNGTMPTLDFDGAEAFDAASARGTVTGDGSEDAIIEMRYNTGAACLPNLLYYDRAIGSTFTIRGIPSPWQRATDFHEMRVSASVSRSAEKDYAYRATTETFHTVADRVVALPAALPVPAFASIPGGHRRYSVTLAVPAEYQQLLNAETYGSASGARISVSAGWHGGGTVTLTFPDFSGVSGWRSRYLPASETQWEHTVSAQGGNGGSCVENGRRVSASYTKQG